MSYSAKVIDRLENLTKKRITFLGVGPMSIRVVEETLKIANSYNKPIALIPSRRQVDSKSLGGGYVCNWTTEKFSQDVRDINKLNNLLLSRDHSGPWQGTRGPENLEISLSEAMNEAKESLTVDIQAGFDLIHIDPSQAYKRGASNEEVDNLALELIEHCYLTSKKNNREFIYELGTDEQDYHPEPIYYLEDKIRKIKKKLTESKLPLPYFYVVQTGTKVMETRNVGSFNQPISVKGQLSPAMYLPNLIEMLRENGLRLKEHNSDYLNQKSLEWHRRFGIHASNVAPEFGVTETKAILSFMKKYRFHTEYQFLVDYFYNAGKWKKWKLENSTLNHEELAIISGHYHFSEKEVQEKIEKVTTEARKKNLDFDGIVRESISNAIKKYTNSYGYGV
jgi:hypothetical protein